MPNPVLAWYEDDDSALAATLTFSPTNGTATAGQPVHLWNDKGGAATADEATGVLITALSRDDGSADGYSFDDDAAAGGWIEAKVISQGGTNPPDTQATGWVPIGKNRSLSVRDIPSDGYHEIEVRMNVPAGVGVQAKEVLIRATYGGIATPLADGFWSVGLQGVLTQLGDPDATVLVSGGVVTPNAPADDEVDVSTWHAIHAGVPVCDVTSAVTLNQTAADGALGSGEYYWAVLSAKADGSITTTKGNALTAPQDPDERPDCPAGEIILADVAVDYDAGGGAIGAADIYTDRVAYGCLNLSYSAASLEVTVSPGKALVYGNLVNRTTGYDVTLDASDTSYLWLTPSGAVEATLTEVAATDGALLIWEATTDGTGVTAVVDRRKWASKGRTVELGVSGNLSGALATLHANLPTGNGWYIRPVRGVEVSVGTTGDTSGATTVDVEVSEAGGAWTSLYPSAGTVDLRPSIAYNASNPYTTGQLETMTIQPGSRVRAVVDAIPGGTASAGLAVTLHLEEWPI